MNFGPAMKFNEDCNLTCNPMVHRFFGRGLELGGGSCLFFGLNRPPNDVKVNSKLEDLSRKE